MFSGPFIHLLPRPTPCFVYNSWVIFLVLPTIYWLDSLSNMLVNWHNVPSRDDNLSQVSIHRLSHYTFTSNRNANHLSLHGVFYPHWWPYVLSLLTTTATQLYSQIGIILHLSKEIFATGAITTINSYHPLTVLPRSWIYVCPGLPWYSNRQTGNSPKSWHLLKLHSCLNAYNSLE